MRGTENNRQGSFIETLEGRRLLTAGFGWLQTFGEEDVLNIANAVVADSAGNTYVAGAFSGFATFDRRPGKGHVLAGPGDADDLFVAKYDAQGKLRWARRFGAPKENDSATALALGPHGVLYVTGIFQGTASFGLGKHPIQITSRGNTDIFVMALDATGNVTWAESIGGSREDFVNAIAVDPAGKHVFLAGTIRMSGDIDPSPKVTQMVTTRGVNDTVIESINAATGKLEWSRMYGESDTSESVFALAADNNGGVYLAGSFVNTVQFDRSSDALTLESQSWNDIYLGRLDSSGNWSFLKTIGGDKDQTPAALVRAKDGDLFMTGNFSETVDFNPGGALRVLTAIGDSDAFVARYSPDGTLRWAKQFGNSDDGVIIARAIAVDKNDNVYTCGEFANTIDFDPGPPVRNVTVNKAGDAPPVVTNLPPPPFTPASFGASDGYISKLDASGKFVYVRHLGGEDGSVVLHGIAADDAGNAYVVGAFAGTADVIPGPKQKILTTISDNKENWALIEKILK